MSIKLLVVGGANGIGLSIAKEFEKRNCCEHIYIVDKQPLAHEYKSAKITDYIFDLRNDDYSFFERFSDINAVMYTAGFGKLSLFKDIDEKYIIDSFHVNTIAPIRIIHRFIAKLHAENDFYCGIMDSIAGFISSPFFAVYGATKAALKIFIESVNVELIKNGTSNRILNVSPGSLKGTSFNCGKTDLTVTAPMANEILNHLLAKDDLYIPDYDEVFKEVLTRYANDFRAEGIHSYEYKVKSGRL